jgi:hypothetical protein
MATKVKLKLGDIIEIIAPNDTELDNNTYYIGYIDSDKIRLEEVSGNETVLSLTNGSLDNESIESIIIKSRAEEEGYARQNNLITGVWIDLFFGGDLPLALTGKITNIVEDKIEITTFPDNDVIFIDFAYKGLPEDLPIEKIQIRRAPDMRVAEAEGLKAAEAEGLKAAEAEGLKAAEGAEAAEEIVPPNVVQGVLPDEEAEEEARAQAQAQAQAQAPGKGVPLEATQKKIQEDLRTIIFNADQITFGEELEPITQMVDVPEEEQRYDIDKQLDDLLDDMLSTIPNAQRTDIVKNNIHKMIERFQQLRTTFSVFDTKGYALMPKAQGANYKPLIHALERLDTQLYWLLPVTKTIKKLYVLAGEEGAAVEMNADDIAMMDSQLDSRNIQAVVQRYERNDTENETNKYAFLQKELNSFLTPFSLPAATGIIEKKVNTTLTTVLDNIEDFHSSVQGHDTYSSPNSMYVTERAKTVLRKRFALQTYTTGAMGLEIIKTRGENPIINRKKLTANETMAIKAIMTLPEPTVRFARISLKTANVLEKANLNLQFLNYWQLLRDKTHVIKTTIKDISHPYPHEADTFLKDVKNFALDDALVDQTAAAQKAELYSTFLDTIIPKTKFLFNLIKPYLNGKLSIQAILTYLEPFMIYQSDVTFMQYKEMNEYIQEKITEYRKRYASKIREYSALKGTQTVIIPSLIKILDENPNLRAKVLDVYGFKDNIMQMSNADFMKHSIEIDYGLFYNNAVAIISRSLMMADGSRDIADIHLYLNSLEGKEGEAEVDEFGKAKGKGKKGKTGKAEKGVEAPAGAVAVTIATECAKIKTIVKRYIELDELNEDNGKEVVVDKKYDTTAYDIGEKFKADINMPLNEQLQHYTSKLMKNKGMDEASARRDAEAILKGKRTVAEGEYAILEITDEDSATLQYYVRNNETWVVDDTIDSATFADNVTMLCNLNEKCIAVKDKCQDQVSGANDLKKQNLKLLLAEFETSLNVNKDIINNKIEDELNSANARIEILRQLRLMRMYKYEANKIAIANTLEVGVEPIVSPYDGLLNSILVQTDVAKRYLDINKFAVTFTREGNVDNGESPFWLYCVKTNKKMLPTFMDTLARTFLNGGDFADTLDQICAKQGTLSEDGDKWVDKHSGYTIKMIELNADEEYDEAGFKIVTRAALEGDVGETIMAAATAAAGVGLGAPRKYATPDATAIYNVVDAMSNAMGIIVEDHKDFIVRNVLKQLSNTSVLPPKTTYEKVVAAQAAKGKKIDSYEVAFNSTLLYLTFAYYLIAIQISIPPIKTKVTFPGCKKVFVGFPVDGTDNMKALNYVACVAQKMKNEASLPWSAIANRNATFIAKQIEANITKYILQTEDVQNGIKELKLYLSAHLEVEVPEEHTIIHWNNFLPPLRPLRLGTTQDVGEVFTSRLTDSLRKGKSDQMDYISELQSKMMAFSFNIIDLIEKTIHGEQAILRTNGGEPFVENACCEGNEPNTLYYFIKKQPEIAVLNNKVIRLSDIYDDTKRIGKAAILYDPSNTRRPLKSLGDAFSEDTIYQAFIVYCRFNSLIPLSDNVKAICPTKPEDFNVNNTLEESIRKLKSNARNYTEKSLEQLLDVIHSTTKQTVKQVDKQMTTVDKLNEIVMKMDDDNVRPSVFRASFINVLEEFEMGALLEDTAHMRNLKNVLAKLTETMLQEVTDFVAGANTSLKGTVVRDFNRCIASLMEFKTTGDAMFIGQKEETGYKMVQFMKKAMRCLTKEFPNIILNKINYSEVVSVPAHWKLSDKHEHDVRDIIKKHYVELNTFYDDAQIEMMMTKLIEGTADINELAQHTLLYSPVEIKSKGANVSKDKTEKEEKEKTEKEEKKSSDTLKRIVLKYSAFDLDLTALLFKFYVTSVLTDLIAFKDDNTVLQVPLLKLQESSTEDENLFMDKAADMDVLAGNQTELINKIAKIIVVFTNVICKDKSAIDYNYESLMNLILRSKEKEKDDITDYLKELTVEERKVDDMFKMNKLGRWGKGEQKGLRSYDTNTYDQERDEMEQMARREAKLNKRSVVTDMNRDIFDLELIAEENNDERIEQEDNLITYMGEDGEPEEYGMDGDENYP